MAMMGTPAAATAGLPPAGRHGGIVTDALGPGTDLPALGAPRGVVAMLRTDQGMGDFMKQSFANGFGAIAGDEVNR